GAGFEPSSRRPSAAPERTAREPWDRRADVFSLAVLIYEMLSGRRLPAGGEDVAGRLTSIPGAEPDELGRVFARGLARNPADRFGTALDFVKAFTDAFSTSRSAVPPIREDDRPARPSNRPIQDAPLLPLN